MQINQNPASVGVDPVSMSVVRLELLFEDVVAAVGSSFLWSRNGTTALVTAWHNLTGTHPFTGQPMSKTGIRPSRFQAYFQSGKSGQFLVLHQPLYQENGQANWLIHPEVGEQVDVAVVPLNCAIPDDLPVTAINLLPNASMATPVGSDVFVVGFPKGLSEIGMPIWKRASLATEPAMFADLPDRRRVLIDSATREGMSGAPVVARSIGGYLHENGAFTLGEGISTRPIGVYSGRLATQDDMDAQIGIVWPFPLIERIMDSGVMDTFELNGAFKAQAPVQ